MTENKNMDIKDVAALLNSSETVIDEKEAILGYLRTKDGKIIVPFINPDNKTVIMNSDGTISVNPDIVNKSSGLEIGDIGIGLYVDETKGLRRRLNGTNLAINSNSQGFLKFLKNLKSTTPNLFADSVEAWETEMQASDLKQCGKFVIDESAGIIRLPKIVNIQGVQDMAQCGMTVAAGLPNITGTYKVGCLSNGSATVTGAFYNYSSSSTSYGQSGSSPCIGFDASRSSSIYGNSDTVQQEAIQYPFFIQIATGASESAEVENKIELNNPFTLFEYKYTEQKLNNASWLLSGRSFYPKSTYVTAYEALVVEQNSAIKEGTTQTLPSGKTYVKRGLSVKLSTASYTDTDFVLNTANQTFRLPLKTAQEPLIAKEAPVIGNGIGIGLTNGSSTYGLTSATTSDHYRLYANSTSYGSQAGVAASAGSSPSNQAVVGLTTDPVNSGLVADLSGATAANLNLYFYVGETVQNANLIDVGRIQEQIAAIRGYLVESYVNGTSWYRIYSDGWIEQGGRASATSQTVTYLKPFKNTNYTITAGLILGNASTSYEHLNIGTLSATSFYYTAYDGYQLMWQACGY